ncbi:MAG: hypothetical protein LBJ89_00985 [Holosporales bacterium]|jgi:hypothetical protein|nr:hypothetical protein [Holosporales bacterium]
MNKVLFFCGSIVFSSYICGNSGEHARPIDFVRTQLLGMERSFNDLGAQVKSNHVCTECTREIDTALSSLNAFCSTLKAGFDRIDEINRERNALIADVMSSKQQAASKSSNDLDSIVARCTHTRCPNGPSLGLAFQMTSRGIGTLAQSLEQLRTAG